MKNIYRLTDFIELYLKIKQFLWN